MPRKPRGPRGSIRVLISLTPEELAEIDRSARVSGLDRSSFIRSVVLRTLRIDRMAARDAITSPQK